MLYSTRCHVAYRDSRLTYLLQVLQPVINCIVHSCTCVVTGDGNDVGCF